MDPDLALLAQWRAGDPRAGEDLFARHFEALYRLLDHHAPAEADDLARRAFLACQQDPEERRPSTFRTYLFAMARRELFRNVRRLDLDEPVDFATASIAQGPAPTAPPRGADDAERTRAALRQLPVAQQLLLELHAWHGMDDAALAEILDVPADEVPMKLERARAALRRALDER